MRNTRARAIRKEAYEVTEEYVRVENKSRPAMSRVKISEFNRIFKTIYRRIKKNYNRNQSDNIFKGVQSKSRSKTN